MIKLSNELDQYNNSIRVPATYYVNIVTNQTTINNQIKLGKEQGSLNRKLS
jgi:hypothetical protein